MGTDKVMTIDDGMKRRGRRVAWLVALGSTTLLNAAVTKSYGAELSQSAQAVRSFSIPAQSLDDGLARFGQQGGWQVSVDGNLAKSLTTHGVSGTMTSAQALDAILSGTGLTYTITGGRTVVLTKAAASIILGPVRVGGTLVRQDPTGPGVGYVADTTMAGTKTNTPITEIPNSIYVVTKQEMIDQQPQNVAEALRYTPGIYAEGGGDSSTGASQNSNVPIYQRGFATAQFVDGLISRSSSAGETSFLERIEAVNGPASVMYGQLNPGGMLDMSLKKPTKTPLHQVSLGFGNWGRYETTIDISDKLSKSGNVRYRVAAIGVTQGTQIDHVDYHRVGVLPSLTWDITSKTSLILLGSYMYTPGDGTGSAYPVQGTLITNSNLARISRHTFLGLPNFNDVGEKDAMFEYQFKHDFDKYISFSQIFRWERNIYNQKSSYFSSVTDIPNISVSPWANQYVATQAALDTRVYGKFHIKNVMNTWVFGTDFRNYSSNEVSQFDFNTPILNVYNPQPSYTPCYSLSSSKCNVYEENDKYSYFQEGIYFQDQLKYKRLSVLLGGRQDWVDYKSHGMYKMNYEGSFDSGPTEKNPQPRSAFTWRGGLIYNFDLGLSPYFSYGTSFMPQTQTNWLGQPFAPLSGKQLEAGVKYKIPGRDVLFTASAFHIVENHYLIADLVHSGGYSVDGGTVKSQGFEVSANANITKNLKLVASYTFEDVRFGRSSNADQSYNPITGSYGASVGESGKFVPYVPRNMLNIFADYTFANKSLSGFGINGGIRYVGTTYSDYIESYKTPDYILFDVGAHYDFGRRVPELEGLRAQLSISNLTNKYYVTSCATYQCYIGQGRRVYGNLIYNW